MYGGWSVSSSGSGRPGRLRPTPARLPARERSGEGGAEERGAEGGREEVAVSVGRMTYIGWTAGRGPYLGCTAQVAGRVPCAEGIAEPGGTVYAADMPHVPMTAVVVRTGGRTAERNR